MVAIIKDVTTHGRGIVGSSNNSLHRNILSRCFTSRHHHHYRMHSSHNFHINSRHRYSIGCHRTNHHHSNLCKLCGAVQEKRPKKPKSFVVTTISTALKRQLENTARKLVRTHGLDVVVLYHSRNLQRQHHGCWGLKGLANGSRNISVIKKGKR